MKTYSNAKKLDTVFQYSQLVMVVLLLVQGIMLIVQQINEFYVPIWAAVAAISVFQLVLVFFYPKDYSVGGVQIPRKELIQSRILAVLPFLLILIGLIFIQINDSLYLY